MRAALFGRSVLVIQLDRLLLVLKDLGEDSRRPDGDIRQHQHGEESGDKAAHGKILPDLLTAPIRGLDFGERLTDDLVRGAQAQCRHQ